MTVIRLADHADAKAAAEALSCPHCGGEWFESPGITVHVDGHPTGYALPLACKDCGAEVTP